MTVREVIRRALQMLRVISAGETPSGEEVADGLIAYNGLISSLRGYGVGPSLRPMLSSNGYARVGGVHSDSALVTPLDPSDGARFGVTGACSVTSDRTIEDGTVTVAAVWFYRADIDTWIKEAEASDLDGEPQFPSELHEGLAAMLAMRLPDYGPEPSQSVAVMADEAMGRMVARYRPRVETPCDPGAVYMSRRAWDRSFR